MSALWRYARQYRARWLWGALMLLLTNLAAMSIPQLFRFAIDGIRGGAVVGDLRDIAVAMAMVAVAGAVFRTMSRIHIFYAARDVEMNLRCGLYRHLTTLNPSFYHEHAPGDLMSRATNDLVAVRAMLGPGVLNMVNTAIAYGTALPLMAMISPSLTLLTLVVYPPALFIMRAIAQSLYRRTRAQQQAMGRISDFVQENLAGMHVVRAFNREQHREAQFSKLNQDHYEKSLKLAWSRGLMQRVVVSIGSLGVLLAVYLGARGVLAGAITAGELVAMVEYMALLAWPTFALGWVLTTWQRGVASFSRLSEILQVQPSIVSGPLVPAQLQATLETRQLSIRLEERTVLDQVTVRVSAGSTLGVVGPIGSGKSLLVQAFLRLLDVPEGRVFVGDTDVTQLDLDCLRRMFGYVPQSHTLFSKSLAANVAFGNPTATREEIAAALHNAAFETDLQALPKGLDTPVGERGITLSGGQKQRTAIARVLLLNPPILILDDALSSVDAETETRILQRLRQAREGRTTVIVAHRVSAVQHADEIIVMDQGRIVERGAHDELLAGQRLYAQMARRQNLESAAGRPAAKKKAGGAS